MSSTTDREFERLYGIAEVLTSTAIRTGAAGLAELLHTTPEDGVAQFLAAVSQCEEFVEENRDQLSVVRGWEWA